MTIASPDILRFSLAGRSYSDDELRDALREGRVDPDEEALLDGTSFRFPVRAYATLGVRVSNEPLALPILPIGDPPIPDALAQAPADVIDLLMFVVFENDISVGPQPGAALRAAFESGRHQSAFIALFGTRDFFAARRVFDRATAFAVATSAPDIAQVRCPTCLEYVAVGCLVCPECDESMSAPIAARAGSIPDEPPDAGFFRLHWRPMITVGAVVGLLMSGILLRFLAPGRFFDQRAASAATQPTAACDPVCWVGEACQLGKCIWQKPNEASSVGPAPTLSGPFELPKDASDVLLLDADRFAVGTLGGVQIRSAKTGQLLELVSEAHQVRRLVRVDDTLYAVGREIISVIDARTTRLQKSIDFGGIIGDVIVGAGGRRVLVSLPGVHAVSIVSTDLHAEIDRIRFGDDTVGPLGLDDSGKRGITTTGMLPVSGLPDPQGGAVYAFDPSRLATAQDRVRASMIGNPVSVLMSPSGDASYVALRGKNEIVPLEWEESGSIRQRASIEACDQPEQLELVREGRRALARCSRGRAIEVFDLDTDKLVRHIPFNAPAVDMAVTPDGAQVIVALASDTDGSLGVVDLTTYNVSLLPLNAPPSRVRLAPDGSGVLVSSDRSKVAWIVR